MTYDNNVLYRLHLYLTLYNTFNHKNQFHHILLFHTQLVYFNLFFYQKIQYINDNCNGLQKNRQRSCRIRFNYIIIIMVKHNFIGFPCYFILLYIYHF